MFMIMIQDVVIMSEEAVVMIEKAKKNMNPDEVLLFDKLAARINQVFILWHFYPSCEEPIQLSLIA